jgi:uncharacterized LabA/DUF88 family protein
MKKAIVLIDGQNLFYGLKDMLLKEKDINWTAFFNSLIDPTSEELIRTYWFRPQRILDSNYTAFNIRNQIYYKNHRAHFNNFKNDKSKIPTAIANQAEAEAIAAENWLRSEKVKFSQIEFNYEQLALSYGDIEFVKTGGVKVNPYIQEYLGEKGVDIALAVKMIALSVDNSCDKIVLISGDYDYAEAIKFVKNKMTKVHIVKLHKGQPPTNRSVSRNLAVLVDKIIDVYESELKSTFAKGFVLQNP